MCGIAGFSVANGDTKLDTRLLTEELLLGIESRGRQATGAAWFTPLTDSVDLTKVPVTATTFLKHRLEHIPQAAPVMILHTRYGTHGDGSNRLNLHPVVHGDIVGVHNGVLRNHHKLFKAAGRTPLAEVDTEGLMAVLNTEEHPADVLGQMEGDAAIAWLDLHEPEVLHLACVTGRPLCIAQTEEGSLIFASTALAIRHAAKAAKVELVFEEEVKEETYMRVVAGVITEVRTIPGVTHSDKAFRQQYAWTSGKTPQAPTGGRGRGSGAHRPATAAPTFTDAPRALTVGTR